MKKDSCPGCGEPGKAVKEITLRSMLKESEKERIGADRYFFCRHPSCSVVYFDEPGESIFEKDALKVRVGIKESEAPRRLCYCFDHTIEEIEEEIVRTGKSTVLIDIATRMKEACWCETKNPMGGCCMTTVSKYVKEATAKLGPRVASDKNEEFIDCCSGSDEAAEKKEDCNGVPIKPAVDSRRKLGALATTGAVFTAVLSSACCWLPLLLIFFGVSAAGVSGFFKATRFWFLGATGVLLALGFYLMYFRKEKCAPDSACAAPNPKLQRFNKIMLWCATIIVTLFSFFPDYLGVIPGEPNAGEIIPDNLDQISMHIEGMTCQACATTLQANLSKVDDVRFARVDYDNASALIGVPKGSRIPEQSLLKAVEEAGYKATFRNLITKTIAIEGMTCEACAFGLQQKLSGIAGIKSARVNFSKGQATITAEKSVTNQSLQKAVAAAGYTMKLKSGL